MPHARAMRPRGKRALFLGFLPVVLVLIAAGAFVYASKSPQALFSPTLTPISVDEAVQEYRANPKPLRSDIAMAAELPAPPAANLAGFTPPEPGVYVYKTSGSDWVDYNGQRYERTFPDITPGIVLRDAGCVWELYFKTAREYTDGHRQCSAPGEFLCLAHISDISFGSVAKDMTHTCDPGMIQVGAKAVGPGGTQSTTCYSGEDASKISITFKENTTVDVGGVPVPAYRVELVSTIEGHNMAGSAKADVYFETKTGTYLKLVRSQDTSAMLPDGTHATYQVRISYELTSLTPRT